MFNMTSKGIKEIHAGEHIQENERTNEKQMEKSGKMKAIRKGLLQWYFFFKYFLLDLFENVEM